MQKHLYKILIGISILLFSVSYVFAAPLYTPMRTINPELDNTYDLGSSTLRWKNIYGGAFIGDGSQLTGISAGQFTTSSLAGLTDTAWQLLSGNNLLSIGTSTSPSRITFTATTTPTFTTVNGVNPASWLTSAITSLNGSTSSTQTFSQGNGIGISTLNGVHTFTNTSSSQWTTTSTGIFYNGGSVGIGTNVPDNALSVNGTGHFNNNLYVDGTASTTQLKVVATSSFPSGVWSSNGNVGIGTTTPATALVVNGAITQTSLGTGLMKSTSGVLGNATSGTDYQSPLSTASTSSLALNGNTLYNNGVTSTIGSTYIGVSLNGGTATITNIGVTSLTSSSSIGLSNATGTVNIGAKGYPIQALFQYASSTTIWNDVIFIPRATSTISNVACVNKVAGDTVTLNFYYGISADTATTSAFKLFSSDQTITSTSTPTILTINASSTPSNNNPLRMVASNASSTTHCTLNYYEN